MNKRRGQREFNYYVRTFRGGGGGEGCVFGVGEEDPLKCECMRIGGRESLKCEYSHIDFLHRAPSP